MTSSESEGQPTSRKRSRTSASSEDAGSKKARGRPRVDTQDETAADRRRTQIRLAQRAYRQRKETTISSLKKQVNQLQSTIEEMNQSFLHFNDSAIQSGILNLRPELANELKTVTETFVKLAKAAVTDRNASGDEELEEGDIDPAAELHNAATAARASRGSHTIPTRTSPPIPEHTDIGWGYSARYDNEPEQPSDQQAFDRSLFFTPNSSQSDQPRKHRLPLTVGQVLDQSRSELDANGNNSSLPFGLVDILMRDVSPNSINPQTFFATIPSPKMNPATISPPPTRTPSPPLTSQLLNPGLSKSMTLKSPYTYSFQESTFARRLTRAALEHGFKLLNMASVRPAAVNHVFRLSLPYISVDQMRERFRDVLMKGTRDPLDCWSAPFIHLGGAGTHYPRKDANGNIIPVPNSWNVRSIGPQRQLRLENSADNTLSQELDIDLLGYEGEFFDSHDVEGYLEEKGLRIEAEASFAEAYIEFEDDQYSGLGSVVYSNNINMNLDFADVERSIDQNGSPDASSIDSALPATPRTPNNAMPQLDQLLSQTEPPFNLDMGFGFPDFGKMNGIDTAGIFDQPLALDLAGAFDTNFSSMGYTAFDMMGTEVEPEIVKQKQKRTVLVDVQKLIDELIKRGVCLGRSPGFRRKDVDMAFKASVIQAH